MRWPWVSRGTLEAAEQARDRALEERNELMVRLDMAAQDRQKVVEEGTAERQKLLDRILEMTGQRPMYRESTESAAPRTGVLVEVPKREEKSGPVPVARPRVTADEMHAKFREAVRTGTVDANTVRSY